jgi:hypothetical protein
MSPSFPLGDTRLKAAAREVDNSTVAVEVALQPLIAAI